MAASGGPDITIAEVIDLLPVDLNDNLQEQRDELLALESIFTDTNRLKIVAFPREVSAEEDDLENVPSKNINGPDGIEQALIAFQVDVLVDLDESGLTVEAFTQADNEENMVLNNSTTAEMSPSKPQFERSVSGQRWIATFHVHHLTQLCLNVIFPESYPADKAPQFTLSCMWLDKEHLSLLCKELDRLWEESPGMPIVYTWLDWLQYNALSSLGIEDKVYIGSNSEEESINSVNSDHRAVCDKCTIDQKISRILRCDYEQDHEKFLHNNQLCGICFDEKLGRNFFRLSECKHHFCADCLASYCDFHVQEGTVQKLNCPEGKCKTSLPPGLMQAVLTEDAYERWERLLLQNTLDMMADVEWCPRCNSCVIQEEEQSLQLAHCTACVFSFCTKCKEPWHVGQKCVIPENDEENDEEAAKSNAKKKGTLFQKRQKRQNLLSAELIRKVAKPCPKCNSPIEKDGGCNKVQCTRCGASMCWLCGAYIQGYEHFGSCDMFGDLFYQPPYRIRREVHERARRVQEHIRENPDPARRRVGTCPNCKQPILKEGRDNNMRCYNCSSNFCFLCKDILKPPITAHYKFGAACSQHTD